ncbi:MAG: SAV_6107 family HEPN domain-containing protein [Pseudonocardiales bacterium]
MARVPPPARQSALVLLSQARRALDEAAALERPAERYAATHLAALRAAAAVLAARARPVPAGPPRRSARPTSAWALLCRVAPELTEWAGFFAAGAAKRAAAEAGLPRSVTVREADDLLRDAETFLAVVETLLGLLVQPVLISSSR